MFLFLHSSAAIAITQQVDNPAIAFAVGVASHFLLDLIPHGDSQIEEWMDKKKPRARVRIFAVLAAIDTVLVGLVVWILSIYVPIRPSAIAAVAGSISPDYLWGVHEVTKWRWLDGYRKFHNWFQSFKGRDVPTWLGIIYQALLACILVNFAVR